MLFAGFSVADGELTLFGVVAAGVLGNLVGSWIAYAVGYYGRLDLLEKNRLIHISPKHLKWADDWFERYGAATVFFSRMLPIVRTFISLPAGDRENALLALHRLHPGRLHPLGPDAGADRRSGRRELGGVARHTCTTSTTRSSRRSSPASSTWSSAGAAGGGDPDRGAERDVSIPAGRALALGVVQGPAELLPVSSSAHIVLLPWLAGWDWDELDPELRKSFEVALHAGAAAALLIGQRQTIAEELRAFDPGAAVVLVLSFLPAAAVGYGLERQIERRLGGPRATAVGLLAGAAAMLVADTRPQRPRARRGRRRPTAWRSASPRRRRWRRASPATGSPWRRRAGGGFSRDQANLLSRTIALPIIVGATLLKGVRLAPPRRLAGAAPLDGDRDRRLLRLDPRLAAADPPGRARPRALALRRLPGRPRRRRSCEAAESRDERGLLESRGRPGRRGLRGRRAGPRAGRDRPRPPLPAGAAARPLRERDPDRRATPGSRSPPTGSAPSCSSPRSSAAGTRSGSTAWR